MSGQISLFCCIYHGHYFLTDMLVKSYSSYTNNNTAYFSRHLHAYFVLTQDHESKAPSKHWFSDSMAYQPLAGYLNQNKYF